MLEGSIIVSELIDKGVKVNVLNIGLMDNTLLLGRKVGDIFHKKYSFINLEEERELFYLVLSGGIYPYNLFYIAPIHLF